jgi:dTDP-4-dehydrorhamnose reductase
MAKQRRVLVIGASGQVGNACLRSFSQAGWDTVGTYMTRPKDGLIALDLCDRSAIEHTVIAMKPDMCVLSGALTNVDKCEDEPSLANRVNADAPGAVAEAMNRLGGRTVFLSTEYVFDGTSGPYAEGDPTNPISTYGATKLAGECVVLGVDSNNLVVRTTVVYSWDPHGMNFVMQLWRRLTSGNQAQVPVDQISSPTYAPELGNAIARVSDDAKGVLHIAGPDVLSRMEFAKIAVEVIGLDPGLLAAVETSSLKQRARRPLNAGLKTEKLEGFGVTMSGAKGGIADLRRQSR